MDKLNTTQAENILRAAGYEPDKPISCMTTKQLYMLIKFTVNRAMNQETY